MLEKTFKKPKKQVHKFSTKVIAEIYKRDGLKCILCGSRYGLSAHHVYWHTFERIKDGTQNDRDKGVTLCFNHHTGNEGVHNGNKEADQKCHEYLKNRYKKEL